MQPEPSLHDPERRSETKQAFTPYEEVKACVRKFKSGLLNSNDFVSYQVTLRDWWKLGDEFDINGRGANQIPRFSYNAATSTLTIEGRGYLHQSACGAFHRGLVLSSASMSKSMDDRLNFTMNLDYFIFEGKYQDSQKIPDCAVELANEDEEWSTTKCILEVGDSEPYEHLVKDAQLWIEGQSSVSMVVLLKFVEDPYYPCPLDCHMDSEDIERLGFTRNEYGFDVNPAEFVVEGEYGPVKRLGEMWAGEIKEVFMEIWKRNLDTGKAEKSGQRRYIVSQEREEESPQLRFSDFLPISPDDDRVLSINWDKFRAKMKPNLRLCAIDRCYKWLGQCKAMQEQCTQ